MTVVSTGCSRHKQEAIILANQGDQVVELDPNSAIQKYEQATQLDPTSHQIFYKLAKAYKKKEEWDKAATALARATDIAPSYANYWYERGWALEKRAEKQPPESRVNAYEECKQPYQKCVEADPNKDECYSRLGVAHLFSDDEQKALANFTKAIEFRPDDISYYPRLADLYMRLGYSTEAEQVLNAAKDMADPKDKVLYHVHTLLSAIHRDRGDVNKMVAELEAAKAVTAEDPALLFNLGMAYAQLKPPKKAEALQMLKGFTARACKGKAAATYQTQCEQSQSAMARLKGPGS